MVDVVGAAKVVVETVVDEAKAKQAGKKTGEAVADGVGDAADQGASKFSTGLGSKLLAGGALATIGAAVGRTFLEGMQREADAGKLVASLGLDASEIVKLNKTASDLYADNWGASFEEVQKGVAATQSSFMDLNGQELEDAARSAQIFADIFQVDVVQAAAVASVAVKQGLAKDAVEAFDLMTAAAQKVPIQFRDELQEAITEYSQFFNQIGIGGPEAFALLAEGAALGQYGIDKTGDAIKEFGIRAIDTSTSTADAFALLNLPLAEMQTALAGGGDAAEDAFRKIVTGLSEIEDPAEQAQAAIALFGTPVEDLGNEQLPVFIENLAAGTTGLDNFRGSVDRAARTSTTKGGEFNAFLRKSGEQFIEWADAITRGISEYIRWQKTVGENSFEDTGEGPGFFNSAPGRASGGPAQGWTLVGENGPELVDLPNGSYVHSTSKSRDILAAAGGDTYNNTNIYNGPESSAKGRRDADWWAKHGTRFGAATTAGVPA